MLLMITLLSVIFNINAETVFQQDTLKTDSTKKEKKDLPLEATRKLQINTDQGTWISLDVSPDGQQIVFEMLGDLYLLGLIDKR